MTTLIDTLKQYYGYTSFRPGQLELIEAVMNKQDVVGIMPTGGGKSLCYQIPAISLGGMSLIISPLISLMKDQVDTLLTMDVRADFLTSQMSLEEQNDTLRKAVRGELDLLYVSPERLENDYFLSHLRRMQIDLIAIDEAHCVSQWGHDFRPSYQTIPKIREYCQNNPPFAAFTATATKKVREDIVEQLQLENPYQFTASFDRPNLSFSVVHSKKKQQELFSLLKDKETSIIYCNTRRNVERVYKALKKKGHSVGYYHAGLDPLERNKQQDDFLYDKTSVIVATNAFGMGIDKSNVRRVIHYNLPLDMESYYQEAGRAGRDGAPAEAILFYSSQDIITNNLLIEKGNHPHAKKNLNSMITYCKTGQCLRKRILNYFDEEVTWETCENCSNCNGETETVDVTEECQKILSCIYRMNQMYGMGLVSDVLRGKETARIQNLGFHELSTHGIMSEYSDNEIKDIIALMVSENYLRVGGDQYPIIAFTSQSADLLQAKTRLSLIKKIDNEPVKQIKKSGDYDTDLFEKLRALRKQIAEEIGKPPFVVFTDKSLIDMSTSLPVTSEEFLAVHGVGEAKLERYGEQFIEMIETYKSGK